MNRFTKYKNCVIQSYEGFAFRPEERIFYCDPIIIDIKQGVFKKTINKDVFIATRKTESDKDEDEYTNIYTHIMDTEFHRAQCNYIQKKKLKRFGKVEPFDIKNVDKTIFFKPMKGWDTYIDTSFLKTKYKVSYVEQQGYTIQGIPLFETDNIDILEKAIQTNVTVFCKSNDKIKVYGSGASIISDPKSSIFIVNREALFKETIPEVKITDWANMRPIFIPQSYSMKTAYSNDFTIIFLTYVVLSYLVKSIIS
jgi:hypothetical protein